MEATSASRPHALRIPKPRRLLAALSDERLVDNVRRGEAAAFEVLYDRYSTGILGFCRHMLRNQSDAEDAVQHTFIAAHEDILRHDRRDLHVKAWLYTIARNRCLSMLRARREQPAADDIELAGDDFQRDVQQREDLRALVADVNKLPDDQREALVLSEVGDLSHGEIAEIIGCEAAKVKSLVFQARTALIDRRTARETPCEEIREQLATLRGGALRRSHLRHHLEACPGCAHYRDEIKRQRAMLAIALPVIPSAALKANVLGSLGLGGGSAAASAGGGAAAAATSGLTTAGPAAIAAKLGVAAVLAVGGATGAATVANNGHIPLLQDTSGESSDPGGGGGAGATPIGTTTGTTTSEAAKLKHKTAGSRRSAKGSENGFTPVTGESNGDRAREFAKTRGKGKQRSAARRHATAHTRAKPAKPVRVKKVRERTRTTPTRPAPTKTTELTTPTRSHVTPAPKTTTEPAPTTTTTETTTSTTTTTTTDATTDGSSGQSLGGSKRTTLATG